MVAVTAGWYKLPNWHWAVTLQKPPFALSVEVDFIESQPGMAADMPSSIAIVCCIGQSPAMPLAASPLMGSTAQSNRMKIVRRNFMIAIVVRAFYRVPENLYLKRPAIASGIKNGYRPTQ